MTLFGHETKHEKKKLKLLEALVLNGPQTQWNLASEVGGREKKGLTPFSWTVVHKLLNEWIKEGHVQKVGKVRGEKHESELFAPTSSGLALFWMDEDRAKDKEIPDNWERIKEPYAKILKGADMEWMDFSYRTYQDPLLRRALHHLYDDHPALLEQSEMLSIVTFEIPERIKDRATRLNIARKIAEIASDYPHVKKEIKSILGPVLDEAAVIRELLQGLEEP